MLLKVGVAMMLVSLVLATGVVAVVVLRSENLETTPISSESQAAVEEVVEEDEQQREFDPGQKLEIDDEPGTESAPLRAPQAAPEAAPVPDWPQPTPEE